MRSTEQRPPRPKVGFAARRAQVRQHLRDLTSSAHRPSALGAAVALGIFCGCSPLYGFQTVAVLFLATVLRLNLFAAVLGSQVSIPPLGFLIIGLEVAVGEWFRYGRWSVPSAASAREGVAWIWHHALLSWALGSLAVGGVLALVGGVLSFGVFSALRRLRRNAAPRV